MHSSRDSSASLVADSRAKVTSLRKFASGSNGTVLTLLLNYALAGSSHGKHDLHTNAVVDAEGQQQMLCVNYLPAVAGLSNACPCSPESV